jgi:hypothetical protein
MICESLDDNFFNFFNNIKQIKQITQNDNFMNFDENILSKIKLKLSNNIILPHEGILDTFNFDNYKEKYLRRINRFKNIVQDNSIKKIFVRADTKKIKEEEINKLHDSLKKYGVVNYDTIFINYSEYHFNPITNEFSWKREYINWKNIIII